MESKASWLLYVDVARELVDVVEDDLRGAIGSNWQMVGSREEAFEAMRDLLAEGYRRGHETNPRF